MLIHVRIIQEREGYAAQGLEYDIAAQGESRSAAIDAFRRTAIGQVEIDKSRGRRPFRNLPPAPVPYWLGICNDDFCGVRIDVEEPTLV